MKINSIVAKNFKSFGEEYIEFGNLMVLIGPNASGKSNTINLIKFFYDVVNYGVDDAISLMGGFEYIKNFSSPKDETIYLKYDVDLGAEALWDMKSKQSKDETIRLVSKIVAEMEFKPHRQGTGYRIIKNNITISHSFVLDKLNDNIVGKCTLYMDINQKKCKVESETLNDDASIKELIKTHNRYMDMCKKIIGKYINPKKELYLSKLDFVIFRNVDTQNFIRIYDFDTKKMKNPSIILTYNRLDEEGSNLANVLQTLLKNKAKKNEFFNILKDCLPFIDTIEIEKKYDKSINYVVKENYFSQKIYSNFLSDGTVNVIAIIIALYFGKDDELIVLEEPEKSLHPQLLSKIIGMAKSVSKDKQVIITTHSAELIKWANIENIFVTCRSKDGYTKLKKIDKDEVILNYLENDLGLDSLYINGFLGD